MLTQSKAEAILRTVYLDAVAEQIDCGTSPFYNMVTKGSEDIVGKEVVAAARFGINGGIGCNADGAVLPVASTANMLSLRVPIANIFGNIEITDKVIRASQNSSGNFVGALNSEMESLLKAAKFNFGRMLFQDSRGILGTVSGTNSDTKILPMDGVKNFMEGMIVDIIKGNNVVQSGLRISNVDRVNKTVKFDVVISDKTAGNVLSLQGSYQNEITGIPYLYAAQSAMNAFYGNPRSILGHILPTTKTVSSVTGDIIQECLDDIEERSGGTSDLIIASYDMRRKYLAHLKESRTNVDYLNLDGGYKTLSYNGIPVYADRFCENNTIHFVNTSDFKLHQLADWSWLEGENGKILRQLDNKAAYGATLVKYCNLVCVRPVGQARLMFNVA